MKIKNLILTAVAALALTFCSIEKSGAQVFASLNVSSNTVPSAYTNTVSGTGYANLNVKSVAVYYSFVDTSTNGTFTIPFQSSPDNLTWYQVPNAYLQAGFTNQLVFTPSTTASSTSTNTGIVIVDTSRGQYFRAYQFLNAGAASGGVSNLVLQVYYP